MKRQKKTVGKSAPASLPATSRPLCRIEISPDLIAQLRRLPKAERALIGDAIEVVRLKWGRPHEHGGIGIRTLGSGLYECRIGLAQRLLFQSIDGRLFFHFLGNHNEVQTFLRSHR